MEKLLELINKLTSPPGVSGFEHMAFEPVENALRETGLFDGIETTPVSSICAFMRCGKKDAPLVMVDSHLDTVGFVVNEICEGGFLRVAQVCGIAPKILQASPVNIYGKETIRGVFGSKPPHLQSSGESEKKFTVNDLFIDTGYSKERLEQLVRIGTPVGFPQDIHRLIDDGIVGASLDDRLCAAAIIRGLMLVDKSKLKVDVAFSFSAREETGHGGAATVAYRLQPDCAIVIDVTNAFVPGAPKPREAIRTGGGTVICRSPKTNRALTDKVISAARDNSLAWQIQACPGRTGTNADHIALTRGGIPTVLLSIPLKNMHTMSEVVDFNDCFNTAKLVSATLQCL